MAGSFTVIISFRRTWTYHILVVSDNLPLFHSKDLKCLHWQIFLYKTFYFQNYQLVQTRFTFVYHWAVTSKKKLNNQNLRENGKGILA